jgi:hypothetical protein
MTELVVSQSKNSIYIRSLWSLPAATDHSVSYYPDKGHVSGDRKFSRHELPQRDIIIIIIITIYISFLDKTYIKQNTL